MFTELDTPAYIYDLDLLDFTLDAAMQASSTHNYKLHYALKANSDPIILSRVLMAGMGADCVSGNEVLAALHAGFSPDNIVFAGSGKTDEEIEIAIDNAIGCINCESIEEIDVINAIARKKNRSVAIAIRCNPGIDAMTHKHITTGLDRNKFGIPEYLLQDALDIVSAGSFLRLKGLHFHIGSQILSPQPFEELCSKASEIWHRYGLDNYGADMLNLGGGLGIDYEYPLKNSIPDFGAFFTLVNKHLLLPAHVSVHFEPGRSISGQCGKLLTQVLFTKKNNSVNHVITDAGMTELMRPALYQSRHRIENISTNGEVAETYDVSGPVCESTDCFGRDVQLPETRRGDRLLIHSCGAYAQSMTMNYLMRTPAKTYYRRNGKTHEVGSPCFTRLLHVTPVSQV